MLLTAGYPSPKNIANIKTSYTFIGGQKKYFCKDNFQFNNYAVDKMKSCIIHADEFNNLIKVAYIENNTIKTKMFDILPENYHSLDISAKQNKILISWYNADDSTRHLELIDNILTDNETIEIDLSNIPTNNLVGESNFDYYISNDGIYIREAAPQSIQSQGISGTTYNSKTFIIYIPFDNIYTFTNIKELSNLTDNYISYITSISIPDGMIFFNRNNYKIYICHNGIVNYVTDYLYNNSTNNPIKYLTLQGHYLYGITHDYGNSNEIYSKNLITNEILHSNTQSWSYNSLTPNYGGYLLKDEILRVPGTTYEYYLKLNKNSNVDLIYRQRDKHRNKFFHNEYNTAVLYQYGSSDTGTCIKIISPDLEIINYNDCNFPTGVTIEDFSSSYAPGIVITTADAWYGSLDMVNFTQI